MTTLPIPFFTAFLLLLLAATYHAALQKTASGRLFLAFLYANVLSMVFIGLRWSLNQVWFLPIAAVLALSGSALLYLAFCSLGREGVVIRAQRDWPHLIPSSLLILAVLLEPLAIDAILVGSKLVYCLLFILLLRRAPATLQLVPLQWFSNSHMALWGAVFSLLVSVFVDIAIAVDFALYEGRHAAGLVGVVNLAVALSLGWVSVLAGRSLGVKNQDIPIDIRSKNESEEPLLASPASTEDTQLYNKLNELLINQGLFADTDLNLQKLARKAGVPARAASRAINTQAKQNVSQWINSARVDAVCNILRDENISITQAMYEAGFLTKSNFNREFKRLKGCSPSQWRANEQSSTT